MLIECADFVCVCSATERCASECFIHCRPSLIILSFNDRRRADPHRVGRRGCRYSQVHQQGRWHSCLQALRRKKYQDCSGFTTRSICLILAGCLKCLPSMHFCVQIMETIKGTMTEIYSDLSKSTTGNTIAEVKSGACASAGHRFILNV